MVESDVGMMGGLGAHEFMAPSSAGEDEVALCSSCDYAANVELARSRPRAPEFPERLDAPREIETPGATTIEALAGQLGIDEAATAKAMVLVREGNVVLMLVRGDHRMHELKAAKALGGEFRPATAEEIVQTFGAEPGSIGAVGASVRVIADEALREGQYVVVRTAPATTCSVSRRAATSSRSSRICARWWTATVVQTVTARCESSA